MIRRLSLALGLFLVAGGPTPSEAQGPAPIGDRGDKSPDGPGSVRKNSAERLIQNEAVQEELKLTEKQKAQVSALAAGVKTKRKQLRDVYIPNMIAMAKAAAKEQASQEASGQADPSVAGEPAEAYGTPEGIGVGPDQGQGKKEKGGKKKVKRQIEAQALASFQADADAAVFKLLEGRQKTRLRQIVLQAEGPLAFTTPNPEVAEKLSLTEDQLSRIREVDGQARRAQGDSMRKLFASVAPAAEPGGSALKVKKDGTPKLPEVDEATRTRLIGQMKAAEVKGTADALAAIGKVLSRGQKATYNKMIGPPFDLAKLQTSKAPADPATAATDPKVDVEAKTTASPAEPTPARSPTPRRSLRESRGVN